MRPHHYRSAVALLIAGLLTTVPVAAAVAAKKSGPGADQQPGGVQTQQARNLAKSSRTQTPKAEVNPCYMRCLGMPNFYKCPPNPKHVKVGCCKLSCGG